MKKSYLSGLLIIFVFINLAHAFWQNYLLPLDGDLVAIVLPAPWYTQVLHDPFGWAVLSRNEVYGGTNRFFAHATMSLYWKQMPHLLQSVTAPITSLHASSALFTTVTQALLVLLLAVYIRLSGVGSRQRWGLWVAAALVTPLFQTYGFYEQMGVTSRAITYTSFYAFPMTLLLLLLVPFYAAAVRGQPLRVRPLPAVLLVALMVVITFNGPIATAAAAVALFLVGSYWLWQQRQRFSGRAQAPSWLSWQALLLLGILGTLCLYSIYIGRNNIENTKTHTLGQLYELLPKGITNQLTMDWGLPLLLGVLFVNVLLLRWYTPASVERRRVLTALAWLAAFGVCYLLLLPFGGYRVYRPLLVRNDSVLPVTLAIIFAYGLSSYFLLFHLRRSALRLYICGLVALTGTYLYVNKTQAIPATNGCEQWSMDQMAQATEPVVHISEACPVLTWERMHDPNNSELQAMMLHYWGVTDRVKLYYQ